MRSKWLGVVVVLCAGCDVVSSEDLDTNEISATIEVSETGAGRTEIRAQLERDDSINDRVELSRGDRLIARAKGKQVILSEDHDAFNDISYIGTLPAVEPGTEITVSFERETGSDAKASAKLPTPFNIDSPQQGTELRMGREVKVTWSGGKPADEMVFDYSADCDDSSSAGGSTERDSGSASLDIDPTVDGVPPDSCSVELTARRRLEGGLSGAWSGTIHGQQVRGVKVRID